MRTEHVFGWKMLYTVEGKILNWASGSSERSANATDGFGIHGETSEMRVIPAIETHLSLSNRSHRSTQQSQHLYKGCTES